MKKDGWQAWESCTHLVCMSVLFLEFVVSYINWLRIELIEIYFWFAHPETGVTLNRVSVQAYVSFVDIL